MANLSGHRQSFLPSNLTNCQDENINWHFDKDIGWFGFDFSGRYYTFHFDDGKIYPDGNERPIEAPADFDWNSIFSRIFKVYHFDKQKEQLHSSYVNLLSRDYSKVKSSCYDPVNMRWFEIVKSSKNDKEKTYTIYSGCIRSLLGIGSSTTIYTNDVREYNTINLTYPKNMRITFDFEFVRTTSGNFLILMSCYPDKGRFTMDLIQYDDEKISHFRRFSFAHDHGSDEEGEEAGMDFYNVGFDLESNIFYVIEKGSKPWKVSAFDFTGNELFTVEIPEQLSKVISYMSLISGSLFFMVSRDVNFALMSISTNGVKICKQFKLDKAPHGEMLTNSYKVLKRFDKHFLCVSSRSVWDDCSYHLFDIETEKLVYKHSTDATSIIYWEFNWNLQEFACCTNENVFKVSTTGYKSDSLKDKARQACLESYNKDQLNANLPSSLVKYIDA